MNWHYWCYWRLCTSLSASISAWKYDGQRHSLLPSDLIAVCCCCVQPENEDELKKRQLMELALLNGTYRGFHGNGSNILAAAARLNNNNSIVAVNNNHNHNNNNNNNIGLLMMAAGPPFCKSLTLPLHPMFAQTERCLYRTVIYRRQLKPERLAEACRTIKISQQKL